MLFGRPTNSRSNYDHDTQDDLIDIDRIRARLKQSLLSSDPSDPVESNILPKVDFLHDFNSHKGMPYGCIFKNFYSLSI